MIVAGPRRGDPPRRGAGGAAGREKWEAWLKCKGMSAEDARKAFCVAYARALSRESQNFRRH